MIFRRRKSSRKCPLCNGRLESAATGWRCVRCGVKLVGDTCRFPVQPPGRSRPLKRRDR